MSSDSATILQLDDIRLRYSSGTPVLHGIDLRLAAGSFHFLSGPNGAGKTSLLRVISLDLPPSSGSIRLFGREIDRIDRAATTALRQRIGVIFQDFRLLDHLSVFDNVALPLRIMGMDESEAARLVADMLGWLGLGGKLEVLPGEVSIGQRQMIAIARAVIAKPRLLLADEPTSNIDEANAERLMNLFIHLHKLGTTILLATHSRSLLARYPYPILELANGHLRQAPAAERPQHGMPTSPPSGSQHGMPTSPPAESQHGMQTSPLAGPQHEMPTSPPAGSQHGMPTSRDMTTPSPRHPDDRRR